MYRTVTSLCRVSISLFFPSEVNLGTNLCIKVDFFLDGKWYSRQNLFYRSLTAVLVDLAFDNLGEYQRKKDLVHMLTKYYYFGGWDGKFL